MRTEAQFTLYNADGSYMTIEADVSGLCVTVHGWDGRVAHIIFENGRETLNALMSMQFPLYEALGEDVEAAHVCTKAAGEDPRR